MKHAMMIPCEETSFQMSPSGHLASAHIMYSIHTEQNLELTARTVFSLALTHLVRVFVLAASVPERTRPSFPVMVCLFQPSPLVTGTAGYSQLMVAAYVYR